MENYNRATVIDESFDKISSGQMEFSKLRKTLENKNIEPSEIKIIVNLVDKKLIRNEQIKAENEKGKLMFYGGIVLATSSLILTLVTFTGILDLKGYGLIVYGPFFTGLIMIIKGKSSMNRSILK